jgi:hypothetical protein
MAITELSPLANRILNALTNGPRAWEPPAALAERLGEGEDRLTDELATLDVEGWLEVWERPEGLSVTLTAWAAERLGVRLAECGGGLSYRWVEVGHPEPAAFRARGVAASAALEDLDLVIDPAPGPDADLGRFDAECADAKGPAGLPRPAHLIGDGLTPWPGPDRGEAPSACPACLGRKLGPSEYCLRCDRWGLDRERPARAPRPAPAESRTPAPPRPGASPQARGPAERLRDRRKARRRARFRPRPEAERHRTRRQAPD